MVHKINEESENEECDGHNFLRGEDPSLKGHPHKPHLLRLWPIDWLIESLKLTSGKVIQASKLFALT